MKNKSKPQSPRTLVDIVIIMHRSFDMLERCLATLPQAAKDIPYNVIIVDNASPKEDADAAYAKLDRSITVIRNKENEGFPKACNQGARRKQSPLLFFLNPDVFLAEDALVNLVKAMDDPEIGIVGMKLTFPNGTPSGPAGMIQHCGIVTNIQGDFEHAFAGWHPDHPKVLAMDKVIAVTGAALMIRRNLFNQVGGFDEAYGRGTYEDLDICMKVLQLDKSIKVVQNSAGEHWTGATASRFNLPYPLNQNRMIFMTKWAGSYPWTAWLAA